MFTPMSVGDLVGAAAQNLLKNGGEHWEDLHIPVAVHRGLPVGLEVEGVDEPQHIHIAGDLQVSPHLVLLNVRGADGRILLSSSNPGNTREAWESSKSLPPDSR